MNTNTESCFFKEEDIISSYSRAQAIEDGVLIDLSVMVPQLCREHYKYPIALTAAVWEKIQRAIKLGKGDLEGIVHDILWMARTAPIRRWKTGQAFRVIINGGEARKKSFEMKIECGPGDNMEPVLTVLMADED